MTLFRCPKCHSPLDDRDLNGKTKCRRCGCFFDYIDGIPLLVRDREVIEAVIAEAQLAGAGDWYTKPHLGQWTGPYRHHVEKRKRWVEGVLLEWRSAQRAAIGLDLGCGDGMNLRWLRPHFERFYASDYNLLRLIRARQLGVDVHLFMADIGNYPANDDVFDVIFFNHVLEHIPDDARALREVRRILKPGGLLILGVPNEGAAYWQLAYRLQPKSRETSDHRHFYTAESVAAQCKAAGLTVQRTHPIGWGVPHWTLDAIVRRFKWVDDAFEKLGRALIPDQATSLYLLLSK